MLRRLMGSGEMRGMDIVNKLAKQYGYGKNSIQTNKPAKAQQQVKTDTPKLTPALDSALRDVISLRSQIQNQKSILYQQATQSQTGKEVFAKLPTAAKPIAQQLTQLVTSPREFASLFVNFKQAFILSKANPAALSFILANQNPNIKLSPSLFAELAKLVAQSMKLKQGSKVSSEDEDEQIKLNRQQEEMVEQIDHQNQLVQGIREALDSVSIRPLKDYLLEAERFAEEEIANLWSITLKKERELEKKIGTIPEELRHLMEAFPHLEPSHLLEKFRNMQRKRPVNVKTVKRILGKKH